MLRRPPRSTLFPYTRSSDLDITPGMLPAVNINSLTSALVVYENNHERTVILAGTSNGLFYTIDNGSYWHDATEQIGRAHV